jgi:hypothetical protein
MQPNSFKAIVELEDLFPPHSVFPQTAGAVVAIEFRHARLNDVEGKLIQRGIRILRALGAIFGDCVDAFAKAAHQTRQNGEPRRKEVLSRYQGGNRAGSTVRCFNHCAQAASG